MKWIVFDYGGVIGLAPPEDAGVLLCEAIGAPPAEFWSRQIVANACHRAG